MAHINELSRSQYLKEIQAILDALNRQLGPEEKKFRIPDEKFRRSIGKYAGQTFSIDGQPLSPEAYEKHLKEVLPSPEDDQWIISIEKEKGWIIDPEQR